MVLIWDHIDTFADEVNRNNFFEVSGLMFYDR